MGKKGLRLNQVPPPSLTQYVVNAKCIQIFFVGTIPENSELMQIAVQCAAATLDE